MTDRRNRPTIVSLGDSVDRIGSNISNFPRDRLEIQNGRFVRRSSVTENIKPNIHILPLAPELDAELSNDFKWLIHFDLKTVYRFDIDEDFHENDISKTNLIKKPFHKECTSGNPGKRLKKRTSHSKPVNPFLFTEIVEECLREKTEVTVKGIFKWIRDKYPCFKSNDCRWKNHVRLTLVNNPLFKVKRSKTGKSNVWYFDRSHPEDSRSFQFQNQEIISDKPRLFQQSHTSNSIVSSPAKEYFTIYGSINDTEGCKYEGYSENWLEYTGFQVKEHIDVMTVENPSESYEIEIPLATQFLEVERYPESMEVMHLIDENPSSISLELL